MRWGRGRKYKNQDSHWDRYLFFTVLALVIFGVGVVFDTSAPQAAQSFGDKFFYVKRQAIWALIGFIFLYLFAQLELVFWKKYAKLIFALAVLLLLLVLVPGFGITALGATRRIDFGPIGIQPAEFAKFALAVFLAFSFSEEVSLSRFLVPSLVMAGLILAQPDMGTAVVIVGMAAVVYFVAGGKIKQLLGIGVLLGLAGIFLVLASDYRRERLLSFLSLGSNLVNADYHIRQMLIALGSGGLFGVGLGQSRQKHLFLPEPATDSIFAIIGEELGFIGSFILVLAFFFLLWRGFLIAHHAEDKFAKLLAVGITSWLAIQTSINLGVVSALLPLTGIPLPFISYGGSSLVISMGAVGILLSISKAAKKVDNKKI